LTGTSVIQTAVGSSLGLVCRSLSSVKTCGKCAGGFSPEGQKVTNPLDSNPYVVVIALDFSKAFDTVRHSCLMEKLAQLHLPDNIQLADNIFSMVTHCTRCEGQTSDLIEINDPRFCDWTGLVCYPSCRSSNCQSRQLFDKVC